MIVGSVILAGGQSTRMGTPKAWLPFGGTALLTRMAGILWEATWPVVVVRSEASQELPPLIPEVEVVEDARPGRGPLEGMAAGMQALAERADAAFVVSCDNPFVTARYVEWLAERLGNHDAAVPSTGGRHHPLAALYRLTVLPHLHRLLEEGEQRPIRLLERGRTLLLGEEDLRAVDPSLQVLSTMNTPEEYRAALERAGLPPAHLPEGRGP